MFFLLSNLRKFFSRSNGNVAVLFALGFSLVAAAGGGAVDYAKQTSLQSHLQGVADAAVLVAAKEFQLSGVADLQQAQLTSVAKSYVKRNTTAANNITNVAIKVSKAQGTVNLLISGKVKTPFLAMMGLNANRTVSAQATARVLGGLPLCVLALEETNRKAIAASNSAKLTGTGCTIHSNSTNSNSIEAWGRSLLDTGLTCTAGGAQGGAGNFLPVPTTDCPAVSDPLASRAEPSFGTQCDYNSFKKTNGTANLSPGVYCGGLSITGNANVTFQPGIYIIKDGILEFTGASKSTGVHVGFFFAGIDGARFKATAMADVDFSAPKDGPMAGLLMFQKRQGQPGEVFEITSPKVRSLVGTIYLPRAEFRVSINAGGAGNVAQESAFTVIVTKLLTLNGKSNLVLNTDFAATDVPVPQSISRLSGQIVLSK